MPALDPEYVQELLNEARFSVAELSAFPFIRDYCRTCDEFYNLALPSREMEHWGHRLTIVPFVEVR